MYRALRENGVDPLLVGDVIDIHQSVGAEELLQLVARFPAAVEAANADYLLSQLSEPYWRMRVMLGLLEVDPEAAADLAARYPREFAWAAGRRDDASLAGQVQRLAVENLYDLEVPSTWALGRLRSVDGVASVGLILRRILNSTKCIAPEQLGSCNAKRACSGTTISG